MYYVLQDMFACRLLTSCFCRSFVKKVTLRVPGGSLASDGSLNLLKLTCYANELCHVHEVARLPKYRSLFYC